ncbi:MAG: ABC transporter permease [Oscillospiraceae bacterium]|nr:ABC transporter permease [Oscillospiraceae bacterium]
MLFRLLKAERMKLKRSPVWLAFLIMPIIPAFLGTANYVYNQGVLTKEWISLWTQHTLFTDYFFLPIMLGVYCAYIMRLEYANHNRNKLFTIPASRAAIFLSKLITAAVMLVLSEIWICALFVISGHIVGLENPPWGTIAAWCVFGTLGGMVTVSIQILFSMFLKSFALPVGISFAGGLSGLVFLAKHLGHIWPYSLMSYGMNANAPQELTQTGYAGFVIVCTAYIAIFTFIGAVIASRMDI